MALDTLEVYVLKPKQATNLITNPSVEVGTTGYTGSNATISRITTESRRGIACLQVSTQSGVVSGVYFGTVTVTNGVEYSFSVDVYAPDGWPMRLQVKSSSGGALRAEQTFTGTGFWQRVSLTYTDAVGSTVNLFVVRDSVVSTSSFYADGFQLESGKVSTYIDGDQVGYVRNRVDYAWNGTAHNSTSTRYLCTHGGEMVKLSTFAAILAIIGLGLMPWGDAAIELPTGGSFYQESRELERSFVIPILINGVNFTELAQKRAAIIDLVSPGVGQKKEPITLYVKANDTSGNQISEACKIPCVYKGGLEGNIENQKGEKVALQFTAYLPYIMSDGTRSASLNFSTSDSLTGSIDNGFLMVESERGDYYTDSWWNGWIGGIEIYKVPDEVYIVGNFTTAKGVTVNHVCKYNLVTKTVSAVGSGTNGAVKAIKLGPDGYLYIVGDFTTAGGSTANRIAKIDPATGNYSNVGSSTALDAIANSLDWDTAGNLYVGMYNSATYGGVAKFNGSTWTGLGAMGGLNVVDAVVWRNGKLYAAGNITSGIKVYDGSSWANHPAGTIDVGASNHIIALAFDAKGNLFAGGSFNSGTQKYLLYTDGSTWKNVGTASPDYNIYTLLYDSVLNGVIIGGQYGTIGGISSRGLSEYRSGVFLPYSMLPMTVTYTYTGYSIKKSGYAISGINMNSNETFDVFRPNTQTITNTAGVAYPTFRFVGGMKLWAIHNFTSGKSIYFGNLTINSGEIVTLNIEPGHFEFTSDRRGSLASYILPGSSLDLRLEKGANLMGLVTTDVSGGSAFMTWTENFLAIESTFK